MGLSLVLLEEGEWQVSSKEQPRRGGQPWLYFTDKIELPKPGPGATAKLKDALAPEFSNRVVGTAAFDLHGQRASS